LNVQRRSQTASRKNERNKIVFHLGVFILTEPRASASGLA
jgi:hypothetical protein